MYAYMVLGHFWPPFSPCGFEPEVSKGSARGSLDYFQLSLLETLICCLPQSPLLSVRLYGMSSFLDLGLWLLCDL